MTALVQLGRPDRAPKSMVALTIDGREVSEIDRDELLRRFVQMQYARNDLAFTRGTFRVRGDVVAIRTPEAPRAPEERPLPDVGLARAGDGPVHVVQPGETLFRIALQHGVDRLVALLAAHELGVLGVDHVQDVTRPQGRQHGPERVVQRQQVPGDEGGRHDRGRGDVLRHAHAIGRPDHAEARRGVALDLVEVGRGGDLRLQQADVRVQVLLLGLQRAHVVAGRRDLRGLQHLHQPHHTDGEQRERGEREAGDATADHAPALRHRAHGTRERRLAGANPKPAGEAAEPFDLTAAEGRRLITAFFAALVLMAIAFQVHFSLNAAPSFLRFAARDELQYLMPVFWIGFNLSIQETSPMNLGQTLLHHF